MTDNGKELIEPGKDLQQEVEEKVSPEGPQRKLFGTFAGVFTPTLLTILGVIMYLREGWVVGNAGLLGAFAIITLSFGITAFTGLSLSSITTNIRIGAGGAFNIISQSLGIEVGGSVGIPLYISQALAVAMYIFGFRAGWLWVFPEHSPLLVDLAAFAVIFAIAFISAGLAFKVQYIILAIIIGSLVSIGVAAFSGSMEHSVVMWGDFPGSIEEGFKGVGFWAVFAVFFPASTGIMAGANMSGDLANPRKSIPVGTLSAIGISLVIYLLLAVWLAKSATRTELLENYTVMIDKAAWGPIVLAGLLGATFSSALSSLVGAPRILQALADHDILPKSPTLAKRSKSGEPRNAMILTGLIVFAALMLRELNAIAPLITMFFLITYAMINAVVLIEQSLRLTSFRPLFRVPRFVSFLGAAGCIFAMFIVNPVFGIVSVAVVIGIHAWLVRRHLDNPYSDVRSGLFVALAEWAAKKVNEITSPRERTWKANILMPVEVSTQASNFFGLLRDISYPKGFVRMLGLTGKRNVEELEENLPVLADKFQDEGVFSAWTVVDAASFGANLTAGMEALGSAFISSNVLFLRLPEKGPREDEIGEIVDSAFHNGFGVLLYVGDWEEPLPQKGPVAVWLERPESGWETTMELGNMDLALLTAYKLKTNRKEQLHIVARTDSDEEMEEASLFLNSVTELARIPNAIIDTVRAGNEKELAQDFKPSISLFPLDHHPDFGEIRRLYDATGSPCLFALDSGKENAFA